MSIWGKAFCVFLYSFVFTQTLIFAGEGQTNPVKPLNEILNSDGTVRFKPGIGGSFDPQGFRMISEPRQPPRFVPTTAKSRRGGGGFQEQISGEGFWDDRFFGNGPSEPIAAVAISGEIVFVGGSFLTIGNIRASHVAKWDGSSWSPLGAGTNGFVGALAVNGTDVYIGGYFTSAGGIPTNNIAKWDGSSWAALGSGLTLDLGPYGPGSYGVFALAVEGTDVYAGGGFTSAGKLPAANIAKWDGSSWSALGSGTGGPIYALSVIGSDVYVGGDFITAGGVPSNHIAKWDGSSWSTLGSGTDSMIRSLAVLGTNIYAGGYFSQAGGIPANRIAKWNGSSWSALDTGIDGEVNAIAVSQTDIYVGGGFTTAGGIPANNIAKWNGSSWSALGSGTSGLDWNIIRALTVSGMDLYAGGGFSKAGGIAANDIAKWNESSWSALGPAGNGLDHGGYYHSNSGSFNMTSVGALAVSGTDVYAAGAFTTAGAISANHIAKWDGSAWSALGAGIDGSLLGIYCLAVSGTDVYAGGNFTTAGGIPANNIAKWDGKSWSGLGSGTDGPVYAIAVSGTDFYMGGGFTTAGGIPAKYIAKWDGNAWSGLGSGTDGWVSAIGVSGTDVYAGGSFTTAGGIAANYIAKWNGSSWSALGSGTDDTVKALAVRGTDIYIEGDFIKAGGVSANHIAKWDGSSWSALGSGIVSDWYALAVHGKEIFTASGGFIVRWNGYSWSPHSTYIGGFNALAIVGADFYCGGYFIIAGDKPSLRFAIWHSNLVLTCPNGGEFWEAGSSHQITWLSPSGVGDVKIEYSTDDGTSYMSIVASTANTGTYLWTVPNNPSPVCRIRISQVVSGVPVDASDGTFTILPLPPTISLSRSQLRFGAVHNGPKTESQKVLLSNSGSGQLNWTATSDQAWLNVTPGSGTGAAVLSIGIDPAWSLAAGIYNGHITVSDPSAINNPLRIDVSLCLKTAGISDAPFGYFDTPVDNTVGITGAIPVTGWALDDIEVTKIEIWRDAFAGETEGIWKIGDAIFVEGARPDVEQAYPDYPLNSRAGWGHMLLTNMLPNHGNGTYRLHAYAVDMEGNRVLLGTKTITCSNATAVKPFGTIDTPGQGGNASGDTFVNFGWVLTPLIKTVPKDGSTISVWVDGVQVGALNTSPNVYNQYRVDVSTAFPGLNNTGAPGVGGPVGAFYLDTTKYANGTHIISWVATDDGGAADGIGSRYFNIMNAGTSGQESTEAQATASGPPFSFESIAQIPISNESLAELPVSFNPVWVKRGFDRKRPAEMITPDNYGLFRIELEEVIPIEIDLVGSSNRLLSSSAAILNENPAFRLANPNKALYRGFQLVGTELRPLPVGSTFDSKTGVFSWMPGPGFLGKHMLVFIREENGVSRVNKINIDIRPNKY